MMTPDGLENKLKAAYHDDDGPYDVWGAVAAVARTEMSANIATTLEKLLKMSRGDLEAEMYRPGLELIIALLRHEPGPSEAEMTAHIMAAVDPRPRTSLSSPDDIRTWIASLPKPDADRGSTLDDDRQQAANQARTHLVALPIDKLYETCIHNLESEISALRTALIHVAALQLRRYADALHVRAYRAVANETGVPFSEDRVTKKLTEIRERQSG